MVGPKGVARSGILWQVDCFRVASELMCISLPEGFRVGNSRTEAFVDLIAAIVCVQLSLVAGKQRCFPLLSTTNVVKNVAQIFGVCKFWKNAIKTSKNCSELVGQLVVYSPIELKISYNREP